MGKSLLISDALSNALQSYIFLGAIMAIIAIVVFFAVKKHNKKIISKVINKDNKCPVCKGALSLTAENVENNNGFWEASTYKCSCCGLIYKHSVQCKVDYAVRFFDDDGKQVEGEVRAYGRTAHRKQTLFNRYLILTKHNYTVTNYGKNAADTVNGALSDLPKDEKTEIVSKSAFKNLAQWKDAQALLNNHCLLCGGNLRKLSTSSKFNVGPEITYTENEIKITRTGLNEFTATPVSRTKTVGGDITLNHTYSRCKSCGYVYDMSVSKLNDYAGDYISTVYCKEYKFKAGGMREKDGKYGNLNKEEELRLLRAQTFAILKDKVFHKEWEPEE